MNWLLSGHRAVCVYSSTQLIGLEIEGYLLVSVRILCDHSSLTPELRQDHDDGACLKHQYTESTVQPHMA